jgi:hypothetical protein
MEANGTKVLWRRSEERQYMRRTGLADSRHPRILAVAV